MSTQKDICTHYVYCSSKYNNQDMQIIQMSMTYGRDKNVSYINNRILYNNKKQIKVNSLVKLLGKINKKEKENSK